MIHNEIDDVNQTVKVSPNVPHTGVESSVAISTLLLVVSLGVVVFKVKKRQEY